MTVYCLAEFSATEGNKDILGKKLLELSKMNKEPGCSMYVPCIQIRNSNARGLSKYDFTFIEQFANEDAFNSHCKETYVSKFFRDNGHLISKSNISLFKGLGKE